MAQTCFCALAPTLRPAYARLLCPSGKLVGLLFATEFAGATAPPFGSPRAEHRGGFGPYFGFKHFEMAHDSLPARRGRGLFICLRKR